jgi:hypothetical protein
MKQKSMEDDAGYAWENEVRCSGAFLSNGERCKGNDKKWSEYLIL